MLLYTLMTFFLLYLKGFLLRTNYLEEVTVVYRVEAEHAKNFVEKNKKEIDYRGLL
jgi:hypothetical protein